MATINHPYLDLAAMEALRRIQLQPRGAAEGAFAGPHKSPYRGTAVEFADYRQYTPGDDIRLVDWKVFARSDRHYVRLFDAERNLLTYLVVDKSQSMAFSGVEQNTDSKLVYAAKLSAALAYLVIRAGDEAGLSLADETLRTHLPPAEAFAGLGRLLDQLGRTSPGGGTDLAASLELLYKRVKRRGILVIASDFLTLSPQFWKAIDLFRRSRFDVMLFHVVHPEELELPRVAAARFIDSENTSRRLNAEPDAIRAAYRKRFDAFLGEVKAGCQARGCDWYLARTSEDPYALLRRCFLARETTK